MPTEEKVTRKLRAILSADVKGYSLLMADDEAFTIKTLKKYRSIMSTLIQEHNGRVVDAPGDNLLAEFSSAVDAVDCAVETQKLLKIENGRVEERKKLQYRIGVNVGDVVQDGNRIYGNGVNVAARIEGLAVPGGVCISRNAYDHIKNKLTLGYEYIGEHSVKNIKDPVRVYKLLMGDEDAGKLIGDIPTLGAKKWVWATAVLAAIIIASVIWQFYLRMDEQVLEPVVVDKKVVPLSSKPSIAVLPFVNTSQDTDQEYFSDGITEDIITDLSKVSGLRVTSSTTTFLFKERSLSIPEIARELNVKYIVEGKVRMVGEKVRINAQLIDAENDHLIWAERYDDQMDKILSLQDNITRKIVAALAVNLSEKEEQYISLQETDNIDAYNAFLKGYDTISRYDPESIRKGYFYFKEAIELDPNYWRAYAGLAESLIKITNSAPLLQLELGLSTVEARLMTRHNLELSMNQPTDISYRNLSRMACIKRQFEKGLALAEKAISIDPEHSRNYNLLSAALSANDRPEEAVKYAKKAIMLDRGCIY